MPRGKKIAAERIIAKLHEAEFAMARGGRLSRSRYEDRSDGEDVLPLEEGIRRPARRPGEAAEGSGERERSLEAATCGSGARQSEPPRGRRGRLLSATKRHRAVELV